MSIDPKWHDDVYVAEAMDLDLFMPETTPREHTKDFLWIDSDPSFDGSAFGHKVRWDHPRFITRLMRNADIPDGFALATTNEEGEKVVLDFEMAMPVFDLMMPPRPLASDAPMERASKYVAAQLARGKVLVGGLGLALYPQFALLLRRPISSITIVEPNPRIIELVGEPWLAQCPASKVDVEIVEDSFEHYLRNGNTRFDTIYMDLWRDAHVDFLPYINHLIRLAEDRLADNGQIQAWMYAYMVNDFTSFARIVEDRGDDLSRISHSPLLNTYTDWRKAQEKPSLDEVEAAAFRYATTLVDDTIIPLHREPWLERMGLTSEHFK